MFTATVGAIAAAVTFGKAVSRHFLSRKTLTCSACCVTWSATRCAPVWWRERRNGRGRAFGLAAAALWPWLDAGPVPRPACWLEHVQSPHTEVELAALRRSVERGAPYGGPTWVERTAELLGLESSLN